MQASLSTLSCMSLWNDFSYAKELKPHVRARAYTYPVLHYNPNTWHSNEYRWLVMHDLKEGNLIQGKQTCCIVSFTLLTKHLSYETILIHLPVKCETLRIITQPALLLYEHLLCYPFTCALRPTPIPTHYYPLQIYKSWLFLTFSLQPATPASPSELLSATAANREFFKPVTRPGLPPCPCFFLCTQ